MPLLKVARAVRVGFVLGAIGMIRKLCCAAALLLLAACATGGNPGQYEEEEFAFDGNGPYGLVVVGVALNHPPGEFFNLFGNLPSATGVTFVQVDIPQDRIVSSGGFLHAIRMHCGAGESYPNGCDENFQNLVYFPVEVVPGDYMLAAIFEQEMGSTSFLSNDDSYFARSVQQNIDAGDVPWFSIEAGQILYIGDLILNAQQVPASVVEIGSTPDGARQMLAGYPNVHGEMISGSMHAPNIPGGTP